MRHHSHLTIAFYCCHMLECKSNALNSSFCVNFSKNINMNLLECPRSKLHYLSFLYYHKDVLFGGPAVTYLSALLPSPESRGGLSSPKLTEPCHMWVWGGWPGLWCQGLLFQSFIIWIENWVLLKKKKTQLPGKVIPVSPSQLFHNNKQPHPRAWYMQQCCLALKSK